jgi:hypothetical protein
MHSFPSRFFLSIALLLFVGGAFAERSGDAVPKSVIALDKLKRSSQKKAGKDLFGARSWGSTPRRSASSGAAKVVPQEFAPVRAIAPPMPFSYMGKMVDEESGKLTLYLSKGDVPYTVSVGEVIDGVYRVEAVSETELTLIYLPLNTRQTITIGESDS